MFIYHEISQNSEIIRQCADLNEQHTRGLIFERTPPANVTVELHVTVIMTSKNAWYEPNVRKMAVDSVRNDICRINVSDGATHFFFHLIKLFLALLIDWLCWC